MVFRPTDGYVWYPTGNAFEVFGTSSRTTANYKAITMTEVATGSSYYRGTFPSAITAGATYDIQFRQQVGGTAANTDYYAGGQGFQWTGSAVAGGGAAVGAMTLTNLITEVQALAKRTGDTALITQSRVTNFLNWAQVRVVRKCPGHLDLETKDVTAITLVADTFSYSFASMSPVVFHPLRLYYLDGTQSKELTYLETDHFDNDYPSPADQAEGIPNEWTRRASAVEIMSVPTSSEAGKYLRMDYTKTPTAFDTGTLAGTSDMGDVDEGLIMFACSEAFSAIGNKDDEALKYRAKFEDWLDGYRMDKDSLYMAEANNLLKV
jgi:hypothetical protein